MNLSETRKGELYVFGEAVLWAFFPIVAILSFSKLDPVISLAFSILFSAVFFGALMVIKGKLKELLNGKIYKYIFIIAFFIGWMFYGLFFWGLKYTTAGNASIIVLMELFFSYLLFNVWKKQEFSKEHTTGAVLMLIGALIILFPKNGWSFHGGDFIVLAASACPPIGNFYQQRLRKTLSSETIAFLRALFTFPFFFVLAFVLKSTASFSDISKSFWILALNGIFILGLSKIWWLEGIHRISVTKANALSSLGPLFTLFFSFWILHEQPHIWQLLSFIPLFFGVILLTKPTSALNN